ASEAVLDDLEEGGLSLLRPAGEHVQLSGFEADYAALVAGVDGDGKYLHQGVTPSWRKTEGTSWTTANHRPRKAACRPASEASKVGSALKRCELRRERIPSPSMISLPERIPYRRAL